MDVVPDGVGMERRCSTRDDARARRAEERADREDDERGGHGDGDLREPDGEPRTAEWPVERREEPAVQRLGIGGRDVQEAEGAVLDERRREAVALVDELLEVSRSRASTASRGTAAAITTTRMAVERRIGRADDTSPCMTGTPAERFAVLSCHVERPLEHGAWERFSALQERRPGGSRSRR